MFTIKFYSSDGCRQVIKEAESFTILRDNFGNGDAEITLHQKNQADDCRIDISDDGPNGVKRVEGWPPVYGKAIIENAAGRTTEIISTRPMRPVTRQSQNSDLPDESKFKAA